jgi:hypothetical protein
MSTLSLVCPNAYRLTYGTVHWWCPRGLVKRLGTQLLWFNVICQLQTPAGIIS